MVRQDDILGQNAPVSPQDICGKPAKDVVVDGDVLNLCTDPDNGARVVVLCDPRIAVEMWHEGHHGC